MAEVQHGLFRRDQALAAGYTAREIAALTRPGGPWVVVRHGTYVARVQLEGLDQRSLWLMKDQAALLVSKRPAVLSHDSAARALQIRQLDVPRPASHLTHYGTGGTRNSAGITRHRDVLPLCLEVVDGVPTTSYARTAADIGRLHGYLHGLVVADAVRELGVPLGDLEAELARMENHPHIAQAVAAVAASDPGAESVLETLGRELVKELDIGEVETQFAVLINGRIVWLDIRVGRHLFECDGLIKLIPVADGGVARRSAAEVMREERRRETEVCSVGLGVSRIYWNDCFGAAREQAKRRLRQEFEVTVARFGRELPPELRAFADAHPRRRRQRLWLPSADRAA